MKLVVLMFLLLFIGACTKHKSSPQYDEYLWHLFFTNNDFSTSYAIDKDAHINIRNAWKITRGAGVKVAIIDESFEPLHEDISENVVLTYNSDDDSDNVSGTGISHGNTCAGHLAALDNEIGIIGSAPQAELILIKYGASDASIIKAFDKALQEGAKVISCSWGTYGVSNAIASKIADVFAAGVTVVFAVGNDGTSLDDAYVYDESELAVVIGVGSSCEDNDVCNYSNYGKNIDLLAPGGEHLDSIGLLGLDNTGDSGSSNQKDLVNNNYSFDSGTSYSAPIVAGVIALMYSVNPNITPPEVRENLIQSAQKIGTGVDYDNDGFNIERGFGKIDAYKAVLLSI